MGRNGESGAFGLAAARGGVASAGVGARFARLGTGIGIGAGTSNVASEPLRDRTEGDAVDESHVSGEPRASYTRLSNHEMACAPRSGSNEARP